MEPITTNTVQPEAARLRPANHPPFDFSQIITTGNVEQRMRENAEVSDAEGADGPKRKPGRPKKD